SRIVSGSRSWRNASRRPVPISRRGNSPRAIQRRRRARAIPIRSLPPTRAMARVARISGAFAYKESGPAGSRARPRVGCVLSVFAPHYHKGGSSMESRHEKEQKESRFQIEKLEERIAPTNPANNNPGQNNTNQPGNQ